MVNQTLKSLLITLNDVVKDIQYTDYQLRVAFSKSKKGEVQKHRIHKNYLKRKLRSLIDVIKSKINGNLIILKFKIVKVDGSSQHLFEMAFTNASVEEIKDLLSIQATMSGSQLEILEIKEIPTYIKEIPL